MVALKEVSIATIKIEQGGISFPYNGKQLFLNQRELFRNNFSTSPFEYLCSMNFPQVTTLLSMSTCPEKKLFCLNKANRSPFWNLCYYDHPDLPYIIEKYDISPKILGVKDQILGCSPLYLLCNNASRVCRLLFRFGLVTKRLLRISNSMIQPLSAHPVACMSYCEAQQESKEETKMNETSILALFRNQLHELLIYPKSILDSQDLLRFGAKNPVFYLAKTKFRFLNALFERVAVKRDFFITPLNAEGETPLHLLTKYDHPSIPQIVSSRGIQSVDFLVFDKNNMTPLSWMLSYKLNIFVSDLVDKLASRIPREMIVRKASPSNRSIFWYMCRHGQLAAKCYQYGYIFCPNFASLSKKAFLEPDSNGDTPLHILCKYSKFMSFWAINIHDFSTSDVLLEGKDKSTPLFNIMQSIKTVEESLPLTPYLLHLDKEKFVSSALPLICTWTSTDLCTKRRFLNMLFTHHDINRNDLLTGSPSNLRLIASSDETKYVLEVFEKFHITREDILKRDENQCSVLLALCKKVQQEECMSFLNGLNLSKNDMVTPSLVNGHCPLSELIRSGISTKSICCLLGDPSFDSKNSKMEFSRDELVATPCFSESLLLLASARFKLLKFFLHVCPALSKKDFLSSADRFSDSVMSRICERLTSHDLPIVDSILSSMDFDLSDLSVEGSALYHLAYHNISIGDLCKKFEKSDKSAPFVESQWAQSSPAVWMVVNNSSDMLPDLVDPKSLLREVSMKGLYL